MKTLPAVWFDYVIQAWVRDGRYISCRHPKSMDCRCYGRLYVGQIADPTHYEDMSK